MYSMYVCWQGLRLTFQLASPVASDRFDSLAKTNFSLARYPWGGGVYLGISGWGCAAGTLEPLAYTRASSAELRCPILE